MAMNLTESYELLGLPFGASEEEVKRAYKQKARELHPDKNPEDPEATEKFQTLSQAYERIVSGSSQEPEEDEVFSAGFFHFVILQEMIRRRRREQFLNRVFGGLFDDDTDDEYNDFPFAGPFGFFGMPFFHSPRSNHRESSSQPHNYQSWNQRRTQFEGQRNKDTTTEKTSKGRKNQQRSRSFQRKNASQGQKMGTTEKEANCKNDSGQEKSSESSDAHGETITSSRSTSEVKKTKSPANAKQKRKNNGQMRASEWQKGRKSKQANKKKQRSYNRSSAGPSVSKSQEHREQNAVEGAETEQAKSHSQGEECPQTSANKTCQGTVQQKHKYFPESPALKNAGKAVNCTEQIPGSGNQDSLGDIEGHKTTSNDVLENGCNATQDDATITETTDCADGDWRRGAKGFQQGEKGPAPLFQRSCNNKDLNELNNNFQSETVENEPESDPLEDKSACNVTQHNAEKISFVQAEVESVHKIILNCDQKSKEEPVKIDEHYNENKQEKNKVFMKETDLLWATEKDRRVPAIDRLNSKEESNLSRTARIQSFQEPATKLLSKEVAGESKLTDLSPSVPTINHDVKLVPEVDHSEFNSGEETWEAKPCGRNNDNQDTVENVDQDRHKINSAVKDRKQSFDEKKCPEYGVKNKEHSVPAATKSWTAKQDFHVNRKLKNSHCELQKGKSAASPETQIGLKFHTQTKAAGNGEKKSGNQESGDLYRENGVAVEKGTSHKPSAKQTKRAQSFRQEHGQKSVSVGSPKGNKGTSVHKVSLDGGEDRYHTKLADTTRKKAGENNETEFESNPGTKLDCDDFIERVYDQDPGNGFTTGRNNLSKQRNKAKQEGKGSSNHKWDFPSPSNTNITSQAILNEAKDFKQAQNTGEESSCDQESKPHGKSEVNTACCDDNPTLEFDSKDKKFEPTACDNASLCDQGMRRNQATKKEKSQRHRQRKLEEQDSTTIWNSVVSSNKNLWTSKVEANSNIYVKANVWHIINSKIRAERYGEMRPDM